jgi:hypothetical protein
MRSCWNALRLQGLLDSLTLLNKYGELSPDAIAIGTNSQQPHFGAGSP